MQKLVEHNLVDELLKEFKIGKKGKVLDIGCGSGDLVHYLRKKEIEAYGIDVEFKKGEHTKELEEMEQIRKIQGVEGRDDVNKINNQYKWPIASRSIDLTISSSVIEHVKNIEEFARENARILKPGSMAIHYFPSNTALLEAHTGIPFGAKIVNKSYYKIVCKTIGTYSEFEDNAEKCLEYMHKYTFYRKIGELKKTFNKYGLKTKGDYSHLIALSKKKMILYKAIKRINIVKHIFNIARSNLLIMEKTK